MNAQDKRERLTAVKNHNRLTVANLIVAGICVALAGYQFLQGGLLAGTVITVASSFAVFAANTHARKAKEMKEQVIDR